MKQILPSAILASILLLPGCGGGGSSEPTTGTAFYIDSAVEGITVQCGSTVSVTDSLGRFTYVEGEVCTFSLGNILLREQGGITEGEKVFEDNLDVAQLLQSLDVDNDPSNGITVTSEVLAILANNGVVSLPTTDDELEAIIRLLQSAGINFSGDYVTEYEAYAHLEETRQELEDDDDHDDDSSDDSYDDDSYDDNHDDDDDHDDDDSNYTS